MEKIKIPIILLTFFLGYHLYLTNEIEKKVDTLFFESYSKLNNAFLVEKMDNIEKSLDKISSNVNKLMEDQWR